MINKKKSKNRRKKTNFNDIFLLIFAFFLTSISVLLLIKNSLIINMFNIKTDNKIHIYSQTNENKIIGTVTEKKERIKLPIVDSSIFLIQPPELEQIEEEFENRRKEVKLSKNINLYFIKVTEEGYFLAQPIKRTIFYENNILDEILKQLIQGPNEYELKNNYLSLIPIDTKILNIIIQDDILLIDLSGDFYSNIFGVEGIINQVKQIIYTLSEAQAIKNIKITIENNPIVMEDLNLDLSKPLTKLSFTKH